MCLLSRLAPHSTLLCSILPLSHFSHHTLERNGQKVPFPVEDSQRVAPRFEPLNDSWLHFPVPAEDFSDAPTQSSAGYVFFRIHSPSRIGTGGTAILIASWSKPRDVNLRVLVGPLKGDRSDRRFFRNSKTDDDDVASCTRHGGRRGRSGDFHGTASDRNEP